MSSKRTSDFVTFSGEVSLLDKIHSLILTDAHPEILPHLRTFDIGTIERFNSSWFMGVRPEEEYDDLSFEALADFLNGIPVSAFGVDASGKKICGLKTLFQANHDSTHHMETTKPYTVMVYSIDMLS